MDREPDPELCRPCAPARPEDEAASAWRVAAAPSGVGVPRRDRVDVFRRWVGATFGPGEATGVPREALGAPAAVLDVAGGKGDLAWLLSNAEPLGLGADVVVCDPRPVDHTKLERCAEYLYERLGHGNETLESLTWEKGPQGILAQGFSLEQLQPPFRRPRHLRVYFDQELAAAVEKEEVEMAAGGRSGSSGSATSDEWSRFWAGARRRADTAPVPLHHTPADLVAERAAAPTLSDDADAAFSALRSARLLLAFHPDEATEPAIDFALRRRLPFAVVPCCVFASLLPGRGADVDGGAGSGAGEDISLAAGKEASEAQRDHGDEALTERQKRRKEKKSNNKPLASYEDFMVYLRSKHPRMRRKKLGFESGKGHAKNGVLFMLESDFQ